MRKQFEITDHTADIGVIAYGGDFADLLKNAAIGMLSLVTDLDKVENKLSKEIMVQEKDDVSLLVGWLNELLYQLEAERLIFRDFTIVVQDGNRLAATCQGEQWDPVRHAIKREIKAVTYHNLNIIKKDDTIYGCDYFRYLTK